MSRRSKVLEPIDRAIGANIRLQRLIAGISRALLARAIDVSEQQLQKYETGANRISASRLLHISRLLCVPIARFFEAPAIAALEDERPRANP